ncbi:MAG: D-amino acid dehydrogenase [Pseudomonadota bacterium]
MSDERVYDVIVLGGGVIGVATAYWAARAGLHVCLIDRRGGVAEETSRANGGQIAVSYAEPWANPAAPLKILQWLSSQTAPVAARLRADPAQWMWMARFLANCTPWAAARNTADVMALGLYARDRLRDIRAEEGLSYASQTRGILHIYRSERALSKAARAAEAMQKMGCDRRIVTAGEACVIEPVLADAEDPIAGATYTKDDESGDARLFALALAARAGEIGCDFTFGSAVARLTPPEGNGLWRAELLGGGADLAARHVVCCLGPESAGFLRRLRIPNHVYPVRGYSISIPIDGANGAPLTSVTDEENKLVFSNLGDHLRVAGYAVVDGYERDIDETACVRMAATARRLFPNAGAYDEMKTWAGLRPMTPSSRPYIGQTRHRGLWVNTGHGTLGWTLAAGSGKLIADMISKGETDLGPVRSGETPWSMSSP